MDHKTDKTLNIIRPFTLNRPEYAVNYKTEKTLCALWTRAILKPIPSRLKNGFSPQRTFA